MKSFSAALVLSVIAVAGVTAQLQYGVTVKAEKGVDFAKIKTYTWSNGQPAPNKTIDAQITAAVDRELQAVGLTKAASGPADVVVMYYSLRRTDVDVKAKPDASGSRPQFAVGTLAVALFDPPKKKQLLHMRLDKPIDADPAKAEDTINKAVAEMFQKYPTRAKK
jgi:hypothetical protein